MTVNYGMFINNMLALVLVGVAMFFVVRVINRFDMAMDSALDDVSPPSDEPAHKKCPYCRAQIAYRAVRCPCCTLRLEGFEARAETTAGPTSAEG